MSGTVPIIWLLISGAFLIVLIVSVIVIISANMKLKKSSFDLESENIKNIEKVVRTEKDISSFKLANEELNKKNVKLSTRSINLTKVVERINSSLDMKTIYKNIIESTVTLFDAKQVIVLLLSSNNYLSCKIGHGFNSDAIKKIRFKASEGLFSYVMKNKEIITKEDIKKDFKLADLAKKTKIPIVAISPIIGDNNKVTGLLVINSLKDKPGVDKEDIRLLRILSVVSSLAVKNAKLYKKAEILANTDGLTKLFTHRYFQEFLDEEIYRSQRYKRKVSIILTDIDHFKKFNDSYGHQVGDFVLEETAKIMKKAVRSKIDLVARYGGEEFIVVLPETDIKGAEVFAERLRKAVETHKFIDSETNEIYNVTISLGVSTYPDHSTDKIELIKKADNAMYESKENGRNMVCCAKV